MNEMRGMRKMRCAVVLMNELRGHRKRGVRLITRVTNFLHDKIYLIQIISVTRRAAAKMSCKCFASAVK